MKKEKTNKEIEQTEEIGHRDGVVELEQKVGELTLGWQRCQADFMNYRRQVEEDRKKLIKMANADLMMEIIPVLDNFQLAAKHIPAELEGNNWAQGIKQIEKQLEDILASEGLTKIKTVGEEFSPELHEAIEHVESDQPANTIIGEITSGYEFDGQVLRPAKVKVSSGNKNKPKMENNEQGI